MWWLLKKPVRETSLGRADIVSKLLCQLKKQPQSTLKQLGAAITNFMEDGRKIRVAAVKLPLPLCYQVWMAKQRVTAKGAEEGEVSTHGLKLHLRPRGSVLN